MTAQLRLGVLASGNGSNLQAILEAIKCGQLQASVKVVLCNEPGAHALARAEAAGVPALCIPHRDFPTREEFDRQMAQALKSAGVDWVILAGFMRVLTAEFLDQFADRVVNIHPSLLPAFPGTHAIRQALQFGVKITGCTVHLVDKGVDSGPILAQAAVPVLENDTEETLAARVHIAEHKLYVSTLRELAQSRLLLPPRTHGSS